MADGRGQDADIRVFKRYCTLHTNTMGSYDKPIVWGYVDVAYVLHADSKSHYGVVIYVGNTLEHLSHPENRNL